jgi:hypothetical protein
MILRNSLGSLFLHTSDDQRQLNAFLRRVAKDRSHHDAGSLSDVRRRYAQLEVQRREESVKNNLRPVECDAL